MAPPTRLNPFRTPSPELLNGKEASTRRKCKFYDALIDSKGQESNRSLSRHAGISEGCGRKWTRDYEELGDEARKRLRPRSKILGRKSRVTKAMCQTLVSPTKNPLRKQPYEAQIEHFKIPVKTRQLQRKMKEHTHGGGRYICAFVNKELSEKNRTQRS